jgi:MYXO-CTERM domain-containing protein
VIAGVVGDSGTCSLTATIDGTIAGDGTEIGFTEEVAIGEVTELAIPGSELEEGAHRLHLFCGDDDAVGRASLTYYLGDLDAPEGFALAVGEARVSASWTHGDDENIVSYELLFSETEFVDGDEPTGANSDASQSSPLAVASPAAAGETVSEEVLLLVNGASYFFAVAAVDIRGNRGPISDVILATPNVTGGIAALTGDRGCACDYPADGAPSRPSALLTLPLMLLALVRRRRPGVR